MEVQEDDLSEMAVVQVSQYVQQQSDDLLHMDVERAGKVFIYEYIRSVVRIRNHTSARTEFGGENGFVIHRPLDVRQGEIDVLRSRELAPLSLLIDPLELPVHTLVTSETNKQESDHTCFPDRSCQDTRIPCKILIWFHKACLHG